MDRTDNAVYANVPAAVDGVPEVLLWAWMAPSHYESLDEEGTPRVCQCRACRAYFGRADGGADYSEHCVCCQCRSCVCPLRESTGRFDTRVITPHWDNACWGKCTYCQRAEEIRVAKEKREARTTAKHGLRDPPPRRGRRVRHLLRTS